MDTLLNFVVEATETMLQNGPFVVKSFVSYLYSKIIVT